MDFIERIFGITPDGGSGLFEFLLFLIPLAGIAFLYFQNKRNQARHDGVPDKMSDNSD